MQNEETLQQLGFRQNSYGDWFYRGECRLFVAHVVTNNGPIPYVQLFEALPKIDRRPLSDHKGRRLKRSIKDCCTAGSVERALLKYDVTNPSLVFRAETINDKPETIMEQLLEDYKRRLETILKMIDEDNGSSQSVTVRRQTKASCYRTFIDDLEKALRVTTNDKPETINRKRYELDKDYHQHRTPGR